MNWKILSAQGTKTAAEASEMLIVAGAVSNEKARDFFETIPYTELKKIEKKSGVRNPDFWIGDSLLARIGLRGKWRNVFDIYRPFNRFGVLAILETEGEAK